MKKRQGALSEVIAELRGAASATDGERVSVGELIDALDERGYGAVLAILPLVELTPIGGIPGLPTALAVTLALVTARMLMGYEHLWLPTWLRRRRLAAGKAEASLHWLKPIAERVDAKLHQRLERLAGPAGQRAAGIVILCLLLIVPPLELVPFATSAPMIVIAAFGLALLFRDGLLMLVGLCGTLGVAGLGIWLLAGGG